MAKDYDFDKGGKFARLMNSIPDVALESGEAALHEVGQFLLGKIPPYPTRPPNKYVRTGTLGRQMTYEVQTTPRAVEMAIGSPTPYSPWVVGPAWPGQEINNEVMYQAKAHEPYWWRLEEVIDAQIPEATRILQDSFARNVRQRLGLTQ